jgi:diguanylate cyclase (GGDEF)-like protein
MSDSRDPSSFLTSALMAAGDIAYEWDLRTDRLSWHGNPVALAALGDVVTISSGSALSARMTADDLMLRQQALEAHFSTKQPMDCEYGLRKGDGQFSWVHDRGGAEFDQGRPIRLIGVMRLIDERKARDVKVGMSASYDLVSGQRSVETLQDLLGNKISTALRSRMSGAFLYAGIDHMSEVNMRYGQQVADRVLFEVGERIQRALRGGDVMGRIHGDRFGIVLSNCTATEMSMAAERFLRIVRDTAFQLPEVGNLRMTISIGGCNFPDYVRTVPDAIRLSEEAMHKAKASGRDRFVAHQPTEDERLLMKRADEVGQIMINAVRSDSLAFAFQPICDAVTCQPVFYESLLRVRRADGSYAGAGEFVPDIERGGRMMVLDQRILEMAVEELKQHPNVRLAINISGLTACEPDWIRRAEALLRYTPDVAQRLTVEITETAVLRNITECARTIEAAKDLGCLVALDDFGVANITYRELRALAVNLVKIDALLVRGLHNNPVNHGAIQQLVRIANDYNVQTVAEGIEDLRELQLLQQMGVKYLQGYLLGQPTIERPWLLNQADNIVRVSTFTRQS